MEITVREQGEIRIVRIAGMLDGQSSPAAHDALAQLMDAGATKMLVDLEQLSFISSAGLRILLVLAKELQRREGGVRIFNANPSVLEVFEISGFNTIITVSATESEALAGF